MAIACVTVSKFNIGTKRSIDTCSIISSYKSATGSIWSPLPLGIYSIKTHFKERSPQIWWTYLPNTHPYFDHAMDIGV